jgi:hypothetical protein
MPRVVLVPVVFLFQESRGGLHQLMNIHLDFGEMCKQGIAVCCMGIQTQSKGLWAPNAAGHPHLKQIRG